MHVELIREVKLSKLDHLFIIIAEKGDLALAGPVRALAEDVLKRSRFEGRSEETISVLAGEPHKITLIGLWKAESFNLRGLKTALGIVAKTAQKQRDRKIG